MQLSWGEAPGARLPGRETPAVGSGSLRGPHSGAHNSKRACGLRDSHLESLDLVLAERFVRQIEYVQDVRNEISGGASGRWWIDKLERMKSSQ